MTMQMFSTTTTTATALALTRTNTLSGFTCYTPVNLSKCPHYTNIQKDWTSYFFAITNTGWQQSFDCITLERERDFHSQNFIKKNIIFNVVVSLLVTNQIEPVCISVAQRKVHLLPIILDNT